MCEWSHIYDETEWSLMTSLIRLLGFLYERSAGRSFSEMRCSCTFCLDHVLLQSSPNEARFHDGSFDPWDVDKGISAGWKMHHVCSLSKTLRAIRFEKSIDVGPIVRNGTWCSQWWGAQWRKQDTVQKCFSNSTEVVSAATTPRSAIEVTCNQVNFLRNHNGTKSEDELSWQCLASWRKCC